MLDFLYSVIMLDLNFRFFFGSYLKPWYSTWLSMKDAENAPADGFDLLGDGEGIVRYILLLVLRYLNILSF